MECRSKKAAFMTLLLKSIAKLIIVTIALVLAKVASAIGSAAVWLLRAVGERV